MTRQILLTAADGLLRGTLVDQLAAKGYAVGAVPSAAALLALAEAGRLTEPSAPDLPMPDLLLIDGQTPAEGTAEGGLAGLVGALRDRGCVQPIVILGLPAEGLAALQAAGADDCIAKPFRFATLLERLESLLREPAGEVEVALGALRFQPLARQIVAAEGKPLRLTEKEAAILAYLHQAQGRAVPRGELLGEVWGYAGAVSTHTVETHIYRLRRKLEAYPQGSGLLLTEEGGYRLTAAASR